MASSGRTWLTDVGREARVKRENLGRVQQPIRIEHSLDPHLQRKVCWIELHGHQVALFNADAVLTRQAAADPDAQRQDFIAGQFGPLGAGRIVRIVQLALSLCHRFPVYRAA